MYLINGNFLFRNLTGIERFSYEICKSLDNYLSPNDDFAIYVPKNSKTIPSFKNIKIINSEIEIKRVPQWDIKIFGKACKKLNATGINFSNTAPLGKQCGFCFIHDIYPALYKKDFTSLKDKLIRFYSCFQYKNIIKNSKKVFTVSEFSKSQILNKYKILENKIDVIPNGWDHFNKIEIDNSIFSNFPMLTEKDYFFTLGSLQKRKNLKWIANYAANHKEDFFAISGKPISGMVSDDLEKLKTLKNVIFLGYISDGQVKALMKNCKAFVFPSYYEGFGIPPLEALSVGAKIIVSNSACLPEIYSNAAYYIDANNTDCNLNEIIKKQIDKNSIDEVLSTYTYDKAAQKLYNILTHFEDN